MPPGRSQFGDTRWSVVLAAQGGPKDAEAQAALAELCRIYWYPLYAFVRRRGHGPADAEDLTQDFLSRFVEKDWILSSDRAKGRFRSFLLAAMKHFLSNDWRRSQTLKRGGGATFVPLDAEQRYAVEPVERSSPESLYERRWALTVLENVFVTLRAEMEAAGKRELYENLKDLLAPDPATISYREAGERLGMREDAVKMAVYRLRKRYRDLLRAHIAATVESSAEVDAEICDLFRAVASA